MKVQDLVLNVPEDELKDFQLLYDFKQDENTIGFEVATDRAAIEFMGEGIITIDNTQVAQVSVKARLSEAKVLLDMGHYKPMGEKHIKYLKKMKLPTKNT